MKSLPIWHCKKTGDCCKRFLSSGPQLNSQEIQKIIDNLDQKEIKDHFALLGMNKDEFIKYVKNRQSLPLQNPNTCIFLKNNECLIHDIKPEVCQTYPLHIIKKSGKTDVLVDLDCPRGSDLITAIKSGNIPESMGIDGEISVSGTSSYEDKIREKYGEDA
ncbi:YkgJ family cysteine cluster protein [Nitrosopumilus adriaticus]|uniref:YkgJ family cysteine cluster protein n=1 Tax=Nitrosopumilus adriaticus TaxID=1580092 RepID=UPI00352E4249